MSIRVMTWVFDHEGMTGNQKLVALALADHCHDDGSEARPGMARLEKKTALSRRTIQRAVKSLMEDGIMVMDRPATFNRPPSYRFVMGCQTVTPGKVGVTNKTGRGVKSDIRGCHSDTQTIIEPSMKHQKNDFQNLPDVVEPEIAKQHIREARALLRSSRR